MIRSHSHKQLTLAEFDWPFQTALDENNRWVKMSQCIPWDALSEGYCQSLSVRQGRPAKDARLVIAAVIIKHKLCLSDRETVAQIQENPYLQYFVGLPGYQMEAPFAPSLLVEIRKRMGALVFEVFHRAIIVAVDQAKAKKPAPPVRCEAPAKDDDEPPPATGVGTPEPEEPVHQGKLILDATVAPHAIRYPTDLNLLNETRQFSEQIIDVLYAHTELEKKPRTYRQQARKAYLAIVKRRRPGGKVRRRGIKQQLQYVRRNLGHIEQLLEYFPEAKPLPLPRWLLHRYWVIQHVYAQQWEMYCNKSRRCDDRIVSISQPHVRPIVRGKAASKTEFGAKLSISHVHKGYVLLDKLSWDAYNESGDLVEQVETYKKRFGYYPVSVHVDQIYRTRDNRRYCKAKGIRLSGKPLGRPRKQTAENQAQLKALRQQIRQDELDRNPIEGKFGNAKRKGTLARIMAKLPHTSVSVINIGLIVLNLDTWLREVLFCLINQCFGPRPGLLVSLTQPFQHTESHGSDPNLPIHHSAIAYHAA